MGNKNNVKKIRQQKKMTQLDLVIATKIAQSDISSLENGKKPAHPEWRKKIAAAFDMPEEKVFPNVS